MANESYNPFGSVVASSTKHSELQIDYGISKVYKTQKTEDMMGILNSAVGDFTERPLQIMIREIAKNLLIFTPIGWVVLLVIIGRKYKGKFNYAWSKFWSKKPLKTIETKAKNFSIIKYVESLI